MVQPRVGARYQARIRASPDAQSGTVIFDPARADERALGAYLADARRARGTFRHKFASDGAWEEAALGALHASGYDAPRALARLAASGKSGESGKRKSTRAGHGGRVHGAPMPWRRVHARLNARRDEHDGRVESGATVLLRSECRMPYVARVERVRGEHLDVRWFYRTSDLRGVRAPSNELFLSAHTDTNHASTVVGECAVLAAPSATELFCVRAVHFPATRMQTVAPIGERAKAT